MVHLHYAFQTHSTLVLILDFVNGGELFSRMVSCGRLTEADARFYICEVLPRKLRGTYTLQIILALEFLHSIGNRMTRDLTIHNHHCPLQVSDT